VQWIVFVPSFLAHTEHYFDLTGSLTYITLVLAAWAFADPDPRALLIGSLVLVWALRLGTFLFRRVRADGADRRFQQMKHKFLWFLMTWTIQGAWVLVTLAAGLAAMTSPDAVDLGALALLGAALWAIGFVIEVVADQQKRRFKADPHRETEFITSGLWAWSRHPNYFGEILLWIGVALIALPALSGWQWVTLISPFFVIVLLTQVSGVPMLERRADKKWGGDPRYQAYKESTPVLVPRPPSGP
jgi:steroid 5-alpha reductase family enzyme